MGLTYIRNVTTLRLDADKCGGCGTCATVCPHGVFEIAGGKSRIVRADSCMECGACAKNCSRSAITVRSGVGCAAGVIAGLLSGTEPTCDCSSGDSPCC